MSRVDLHVVEHVDCSGEDFAVEVVARPVSSNKITSTVDNAFVEFGVVKDDGSEEVDEYFAERLVSWKEVGAVEVAEDPIEVFLWRVSIFYSYWADCPHQLAVPYRP